MTTPHPAGWYDDPSDPGAQLWWDGENWTSLRQPKPIPKLAQLPSPLDNYAAAPPTDVSCPQCRQVDQVQNVRAIYGAGVHTIKGSAPYSGTGYSGGQTFAVSGHTSINATQTSALAEALAPEPPTTGSYLPVLIFMGVGLAFACLVLASGIGILGLLCPAVVVGPLLGLLIIREQKNAALRQKVQRGSAAALATWAQGFFCHRCGGAFWPSPPAAGIPAGQLMNVDQFRDIVWRTGGYAS